jgi:flagellar hook-associated protein FlgK
MIGHRTQAQASAKVIQAVDQMLGTLIDIRA